MKDRNAITFDDLAFDLQELVRIGVFTKDELLEKVNKWQDEPMYIEPAYTRPVYTECVDEYIVAQNNNPVYAIKSKMTKKQAEFLFEHSYGMSKWRLEMLLENSYELEANDKWNDFIKDLLNDGEITKRQYNNWVDRFIKNTEYYEHYKLELLK